MHWEQLVEILIRKQIIIKGCCLGIQRGGTSYTTIQIDGFNNIFTPETTTYHENAIISTDVIGDVVVTQYLSIINNQYTNREDQLK